MNTIAKFVAPLALLAAFGAQAGEIASGDINLAPVTRGTAAATLSSAPAAASGEVAQGDLGTVKVGGAAPSTGTTMTGMRVVSPFVIGA